MHRKIGAIAALTLLATLAPMHVEQQRDPLTKQQRFALEWAACKQAHAGDGKPSKCELFGKIEVVDNFGDVKIEKVDNFGDIKVEWVDNFADEPGEWQRVDNFGDYKVEFVDNFGDYTIEIVDDFPGCD